jgi:hypothetical protein
MGLLDMLGVRLLETIFVLGSIGSVIVLLLTTIEDVETLMESDKPAPTGG